uniref:Uncharacterized protein n=1 Tax=Callorhinchus milii TaxID=7868 RepID=A0A4W3GE16_CALMI
IKIGSLNPRLFVGTLLCAIGCRVSPLRGLNMTIIGAGPAHALYFASYEKMKRTLSDVFFHGANSSIANGTRNPSAKPPPSLGGGGGGAFSR